MGCRGAKGRLSAAVNYGRDLPQYGSPDGFLPNGWDLRFVVRPHNAFGVAGEPIATSWEFRLWGKTDREARQAFAKAHPRS